MCSAISALMPNFCTVYVVSKGKLSCVRPSDSDGNATIRNDGSERTDSTSGSSGPTSGFTTHQCILCVNFSEMVCSLV